MSTTLSSNPASPMTHRTGRGWRVSLAVAVVVVVALATGVAGVFIGRATKAPEEARLAASWQALPAAPIVGRIAASTVWTGAEMIIWGGYARSEDVGQASDGAAYDPATHTWRTIASAPAGVQGSAAVAWTGDEMLLWASNSPDGPVGSAAYDPPTDSWRRLPAGPLGRRESFSSVWTGEELIVVGGNLGDTLAKPLAAALAPESGTWRLLPALNRITGLMPSPGVVWDGHEVFVMGSVCAKYLSSCSPRLLAYDPATDALRTLDLAKAPNAPQLRLIGMNGSDLVFSTEAQAKVIVVRYDPAAESWRRGALAPFPIPIGAYTQRAWLGDRLVLADGSSGLQIYSLGTDTWETITPGPSPLNSRESSAIVWTGTELIAWSGTVYEKFNPTPADGASLTLHD